MSYFSNVGLRGTTDGGVQLDVPVTPEGHLEVAVHSPRLPFGSLHTEGITPLIQGDAVYGLNSAIVASFTSGTGSTSGASSVFSASTGTTSLSFGIVQSRKRVRYRAGQGVVGRFTALYTTPVANSYQIVGLGNPEDGVYFGYGNTGNLADTRFGILHVRGGVREIKTLTVTGGATVAGNVTVTLNGTAFTVAVTNSANIQRTCWEISQGTYTGWNAYPSGATVIFVRQSAGTTAGTQSFSAGATGSTASIAQTRAGAASTDTFIAQEDWNGDVMDGTGNADNPSGVLLDKTKGNVYQIGLQYLGFGSITFHIEAAATGNNPEWITVHTLQLPNTLTAPSFVNPSFPFTMTAYSAGSTTNLTVKSASYMVGVEGPKVLNGPRISYLDTLNSIVDAGAFYALFTIMNSRYYQGVTNQAVINIIEMLGAVKHTSPVIFYLIRNGSLVGNPNFAAPSSNSCSLVDYSATAVTYSTGDQLLWTGHLGETGNIMEKFGSEGLAKEEFTLEPGEWLTLAARTTTGTAQWVTGSINTREDQ